MYCKWRPTRSAIHGIVETANQPSQFTFFGADRLIFSAGEWSGRSASYGTSAYYDTGRRDNRRPDLLFIFRRLSLAARSTDPANLPAQRRASEAAGRERAAKGAVVESPGRADHSVRAERRAAQGNRAVQSHRQDARAAAPAEVISSLWSI